MIGRMENKGSVWYPPALVVILKCYVLRRHRFKYYSPLKTGMLVCSWFQTFLVIYCKIWYIPWHTLEINDQK